MPRTDCGRIKPVSNRLRVLSASADSSSISLRGNAIGAVTSRAHHQVVGPSKTTWQVLPSARMKRWLTSSSSTGKRARIRMS